MTNEELRLLLSAQEYVVIDIETTALTPLKGGRIIEIAAIKQKDGVIVEEFNELIDPEQKIYNKTIQLTGITNEMLKGKRVFAEVLPDLYKFIGDAVVVGHNINFDWNRFLMFYFKKVGIVPENDTLDTVKISKYVYPNKEKYNLGEMCSFLSIDLRNHHRAIDDAKATITLLNMCIDSLSKRGVSTSEIGNIEEQISMDSFLAPTNKIKEELDQCVTKNYKIKRVKYWEKTVAKNKIYRRIYVSLTGGSIFFDIGTRTWQNKDLPDIQNIDFKVIQDSVLQYLKLGTLNDLCDYRN